MKSFKRISNMLFGWAAERLMDEMEHLQNPLKRGGIKILLRSYISIILTSTFLAGVVSFVAALIFLSVAGTETALGPVLNSVGVALICSSSAFAVLYLYPLEKVRSRTKNIRNNLPFAINHMSAIASSKVPPYTIFKLLSEFKEYGEISDEAGKIVRNVDVFGQDITTAMKQVAKNTPCDDFKELLGGLVSVEETGGDPKKYLSVQADQVMFDYRQKRERYLQSLSTYADFYTAVLIAAPLFLIAILAIMNMVGGKVMGMDIRTAMNLGVYVAIPVMNTAFIAFIHLTQPEVM